MPAFAPVLRPLEVVLFGTVDKTVRSAGAGAGHDEPASFPQSLLPLGFNPQHDQCWALELYDTPQKSLFSTISQY